MLNASVVRVSLCFALLFIHTYGFPGSTSELDETSSSNQFDVLIFTQHWPQTVCFQWKEKTEVHTCSLPDDHEEWSIHGVWPTKFHTIGPSYCNKKLHFNAAALADIEDELSSKWINIEKETPHYSFWKHEWEKHGTCAAVLESLNTEVKYFQRGLDWLDTYDMKNVLAKASIVPGSSYPLQEFIDAVEKIVGKRGQVECIRNAKTKESYLFEIRICFDKSLKLIDCDGIAGFPSNCDKSQNITYPGNVPGQYHVIRI